MFSQPACMYRPLPKLSGNITQKGAYLHGLNALRLHLCLRDSAYLALRQQVSAVAQTLPSARELHIAFRKYGRDVLQEMLKDENTLLAPDKHLDSNGQLNQAGQALLKRLPATDRHRLGLAMRLLVIATTLEKHNSDSGNSSTAIQYVDIVRTLVRERLRFTYKKVPSREPVKHPEHTPDTIILQALRASLPAHMFAPIPVAIR